MDRKLSLFTQVGYDKGRSFIVQALWFATSNLFFMKWWMPRKFRPIILRIFGAKVGRNVFIRHNIRVHWPWKLEIGNDCWLGEDLWILNLEPVKIGNDVCLSQGVFLCTGSHDYKVIDFRYRNSFINIENGVWLAAQVLVLPGVTIGQGSTIFTRNTVNKNIAPYSIIK